MKIKGIIAKALVLLVCGSYATGLKTNLRKIADDYHHDEQERLFENTLAKATDHIDLNDHNYHVAVDKQANKNIEKGVDGFHKAANKNKIIAKTGYELVSDTTKTVKNKHNIEDPFKQTTFDTLNEYFFDNLFN